jgi:hypothetical protein
MNDESSAPAIRRLCIALDAERYSNLDRTEQASAQQHFVTVTTAASRAAGLDPSLLHTQPAGDGHLALLPPGINETEVIAGFVRGLRDALHTVGHSTGRRLRLRVAMHSGLTQLAANGFAGRAVVTVSRMCDSPQLKQRLAAQPRADLVLALSQSLFEDHIGHDFYDIRADAFEQLTLTVGDKFRAEAWVYTPEHPPGNGGTPVAESNQSDPDPAPKPAPAAGIAGGITGAPGSVIHTFGSSQAGRDHNHDNVYYGNPK